MPLSKQHSLIKELDSIQKSMRQPLKESTQTLLDKARNREKWPIAQLISTFERNSTENMIERHAITRYMDEHPELFCQNACVFGITGTPGAGKSSLIGELCLNLLAKDPQVSIAILAIDPSSQDSGGALLGDRTRVIFPANDSRVFFRSQASHLDLGGMGKSTFQVTRLLRKLFDIVIIETVGIGQSEIEIQRLSDHTVLVMQPLAGDQVQFMKAGIMEVPDTFVINKCDEDELARKSRHLLQSSLKLAKIHVHGQNSETPSIFMTSATRRKGIDALADHLLDIKSGIEIPAIQQQEQYFMDKWISQSYGEFGLGVLEHFQDNPELTSGTFEEKELAYKSLMANFLTKLN